MQYCAAATAGDEVAPPERRPAYLTEDEPAGALDSAVTRNLGTGGAFILCREPMPVGTQLQLFLRLPTADHDIGITAEVRWVVTYAEDPDGAGMGVKFLEPEVGTLLVLSEYFASLTGTDPAP